jgi:hypothetical protein
LVPPGLFVDLVEFYGLSDVISGIVLYNYTGSLFALSPSLQLSLLPTRMTITNKTVQLGYDSATEGSPVQLWQGVEKQYLSSITYFEKVQVYSLSLIITKTGVHFHKKRNFRIRKKETPSFFESRPLSSLFTSRTSLTTNGPIMRLEKIVSISRSPSWSRGILKKGNSLLLSPFRSQILGILLRDKEKDLTITSENSEVFQIHTFLLVSTAFPSCSNWSPDTYC